MTSVADAGAASRARWLRQLHRWHWISSALSLLGLLLFAATGFTLNHASQIEATPVVVARKASLPSALRARVDANARPAKDAPLSPDVAAWAAGTLGMDVAGRAAEWSPEEVLVSLARPGGDAWLRIDRATFQAESEDTDRGWISYLNDLHKGRHAGRAWSAFIDVFALACLVFAITGLLILKLHAAGRPSTWPVVGLGVVLPLVLALLFVH